MDLAKTKYDLSDLFANTPIFDEPVIKFDDVRIDPQEDPLHKQAF